MKLRWYDGELQFERPLPFRTAKDACEGNVRFEWVPVPMADTSEPPSPLAAFRNLLRVCRNPGAERHELLRAVDEAEKALEAVEGE